MLSLINLIKEKDFLLTFVRTLEAQGSFQMTDRCIVASLLMVTLQDDVNIVTDILRELLIDLINKAGTGKRPKLLLRRTESVAEKLLTNWLAYTLHGFLEDHVGGPLYKLYSALNLLLDKEPIDAITCDARNSLSEDKLIRQKVDFTTLAITAEYDGNKYNGISVLSCDTVSQGKEKIINHIFKHVPYSERPSSDRLDLGYVSPNGAVLPLQDEDSTNVVDGEWKKINTLEHYKISSGACLRLCVDSTDYHAPMNGAGRTNSQLI
jgi:plexin A